MKYVKSLPIIFGAFMLLLFSCKAHKDTCIPALNVNTGYNHSTNTVYSIGAQDPYWVLTTAPGYPCPFVNTPGPANVIYCHTTIDNTNRYISAFPNSTANCNNTNPSTIPYTFERRFCICEKENDPGLITVHYDFTVRVDNRVNLYIDNLELNVPDQLKNQSAMANFDNTDDINNRVQGQITLYPGVHTLKAELRNDNVGSVMGLNIKGQLSTPEGDYLLVQNECDENIGFINGYKFQDDNRNGIKDGNEAYLPGWEIRLNGITSVGNNHVVQNTTTDANGYFTFTVPCGTYTVNEIIQSDWAPSTPPGGSQSGIVVTQNSVTQIIFGNYTSIINGYKFKDIDRDGIKDVGEPPLSGWAIHLNGTTAVGNYHVVGNTTTDANGYFLFTVPPGTYTINEDLPVYWHATTPPGGSQSGIVVSQYAIVQVNFGNYEAIPKKE